jgi:hypothetical protein
MDGCLGELLGNKQRISAIKSTCFNNGSGGAEE